MKKIISLILVLTMAFALSVTAFAADKTYTNPKEDGTEEFITGGTTNSANVEATYEKPKDRVPAVYYVIVAWGQTGTIKYTDATDVYTWKPGTMQYEKTIDDSQKGWAVDPGANIKVTVTNKSNAGIIATCSAPNSTETGVTITGSFAEEGNGVVKLGTNAPADHTTTPDVSEITKNIQYNITKVEGALSGGRDPRFNIATVTLTLTVDPEVPVPTVTVP